jgi:SsrA-binding protein
LIGAHLSPLRSASTHVVADPVRTRKLLLNRSELQSSSARSSGAATPWYRWSCTGRPAAPKLAIGLAKGKKQHDKRAVEKDRDWQRDKARLLRRGR